MTDRPERLDRFMARANAAYYATHDPFADFVTAPEIAQVFGEVLGAWATVVWQSMGAPSRVVLAELGPGRGTLMADALRLIRKVAPPFADALRVHLVETSPRLRAFQQAALEPAWPVTWHDATGDLPDGPLILIGNEFLDALPVRQFVRLPGTWAERHVAHGRFVLRDGAPPTSLAIGRGLEAGDVLEYCEPAHAIVQSLAARLASHPGAALFLDYGPDRLGHGDTLQALRGGKPADPLLDSGSADLTAHVDFPALAATAREAGAAVWGPVAQGPFLQALGLFARTERLADSLRRQGQGPEEVGRLVDSSHRLAAPDRMGRLFKVMALCHPDLPEPPGFATN